MAGTGGAASVDFVLLKAFLSDAKDVFFVNAVALVLVATDD